MSEISGQQVAYWIGVLFGGFLVGAVVGLLPLFVGLSRHRRGLALAGWISCVMAGLILGLILALPVALVFTVVILCLKAPGGAGEPGVKATVRSAETAVASAKEAGNGH